jgi:hypothetical protein
LVLFRTCAKYPIQKIKADFAWMLSVIHPKITKSDRIKADQETELRQTRNIKDSS